MLDCLDSRYVVRTINVTLPFEPNGLGLELTEMCGTGSNDLGEERAGTMVMISGIVEGGGASLSCADIEVGDSIVGIEVAGGAFDYTAVEVTSAQPTIVHRGA